MPPSFSELFQKNFIKHRVIEGNGYFLATCNCELAQSFPLDAVVGNEGDARASVSNRVRPNDGEDNDPLRERANASEAATRRSLRSTSVARRTTAT